LKQVNKYLNKDILERHDVQQFLSIINQTYENFEKDRRVTEHAFKKSEEEYQNVLRNLKESIQIKQLSIERIKKQILSLQGNDQVKDTFEAEGETDDLISTISLLEKRVSKTKLLEEELIKAKELAESSAIAKSQFLSTMTHEIRTPLNAIIGNIHILKQEPLLPEQEQYIKALHISAENLLNLVNDILDFAKIEEGKVILTKRPVNLKEISNHLIQMNKFKAAERNNNLVLEYDSSIPEWIAVDDLRLNQVLNNLISNAIKFTSNGLIKITIKCIKRDGDQLLLHFAVTDNGIGIPASKHKLIFERFTQANSEINRTYGGSGLGLAIVSRLLSLMGTTINLISEEGKGSTFYFNLPCAAINTPEKDLVPDPHAVKDLGGLHILLVEDMPFNVLVAKKILSSWNALVEVANNGQEAVEMVSKGVYDLILMDLQMPVMDGIRATSVIRKMGVKTPIIALTASATPETRLMIQEVGMNNYVSKPYNPDDLYKVIKLEAKSTT
jgi:signal transduction histidine kinase